MLPVLRWPEGLRGGVLTVVAGLAAGPGTAQILQRTLVDADRGVAIDGAIVLLVGVTRNRTTMEPVPRAVVRLTPEGRTGGGADSAGADGFASDRFEADIRAGTISWCDGRRCKAGFRA
ncbi:MAG: hypothetical protein ACN0LA_04230 [Candidatus Longimicrobiales bacterium M2_2A_002]